MTPLGREIVDLIRREGPMSIARYMELCLGHPRYGYYMTRDPFGRKGDFTTAPEVSQMFGEMLGIWIITNWQAMGAPERVALVELGPGRGTLMADVLRILHKQNDLAQAVEVHLVEMSPVLRACQREAMKPLGVVPVWHDDIATLPQIPSIILANEFFDALPIRQFIQNEQGWDERLIDVGEAETLRFTCSAEAMSASKVREDSPASEAVLRSLAQRLVAHGGVLLAIDYGYAKGGFGDTFQAMMDHRFVHPLHAPGEADLTAHVDFQRLADVAQSSGASAFPIISQRELLLRLGIGARAAALAHRHPGDAATIASALQRLIGVEPAAMGLLFKALCVASPGLQPYGFDRPDPLIENG